MSWSERNKILKSEVAAGGNNNQLIQVHPCIHSCPFTQDT